MTQARGYKSTVVIDIEAAFGQDNGTPDGLVMPINTCDVKGSREQSQPGTITGTRNPVSPILGNLTVGGPLQVPVDYTAFAQWLRCMFGAPATTGAGPYEHVFTIGDSMPSFVLERKFATPAAAFAYAKYNGDKIASCKISAGGAGGELVADLQVEGAAEALGASPYDASPTAQDFNRLQMHNVTVELGGVASSIVKDIEFTIDFGLDLDQYVLSSTQARGDIPEGLISVNGSITALFENLTLLNLAINETETSVAIEWVSGAYGLRFDFAEVLYGRQTPGISGPKGVLLTLPFSAYYDDHADASVVKATLTNAVASY